MPELIINEKPVALSASSTPPFFTTANTDQAALNLRLFEALDNATIPHVSYSIRVFKDGEKLMDEAFHSHPGPLILNLIPKDGSVKVTGSSVDPSSEAWISESGEVSLEAPIFTSGGLYLFQVEILNVYEDNSSMDANFPPVFDSLIGLGDIYENELTYGNQKYNLTMISYYDKIDNYEFDSATDTIYWSMPFNWDIDYLNSQPIHVHSEIHIPKSLIISTNSTSFLPYVNGISYAQGVALDPYSSETSTIVHYIIDKATIIELATIGASQTGSNSNLGDKMIFSLAFNSPQTQIDVSTSSEITTSSEAIHIHLSWEPTQLSPDVQSMLRIRFDPIAGGAPISQLNSDVRYNLRLLDSAGNQVLTRENLIATNSSDVQTLNFPANDVYSIEVNVTGIKLYGDEWDQSKNGIAVGMVVVPEFSSVVLLVAAFFTPLVLLFRTLKLPSISKLH